MYYCCQFAGDFHVDLGNCHDDVSLYNNSLINSHHMDFLVVIIYQRIVDAAIYGDSLMIQGKIDVGRVSLRQSCLESSDCLRNLPPIDNGVISLVTIVW